MRFRALSSTAVSAILSAAFVTAAVAQAPDNPKFEVASVKPNTSGASLIAVNPQPGRLTLTNMPLRVLIMNAYQIQSFQLVGAPDWIATERFDIVAKIPDESAARPGARQFLMLRSLLVDRFKLVVHTEQRELPIYALVVANKDGKLGPGLRRSEIDCAALVGRAPVPPAPNTDRPFCAMSLAPGRLTAGAIPLSQFTNTLPQFLQRIVINRTGLDGNFDIDLSWTPEQLPQGPPPSTQPLPPSDPNGPSLFTAVQEQLGLKLDATRGPVDVLVIDHVEPPTPD